MNVLVTGGNGFVGSHTVEQLVNRGHKVTCLVRKTSDLKWLKDISVDFVYGDILDPDSIEKSVRSAEAIVHIAGLVRALKKETYFKANQTGTKNLVDAVLRSNPKLKKFVYISSQAAMGPSVNKLPKQISEPETPISDYGASKLAGEKELTRTNK